MRLALRFLLPAVVTAIALAVPVFASNLPVYRWQDAKGTLHFSNLGDEVPTSARTITLERVAIGSKGAPSSAPIASAGGQARAATAKRRASAAGEERCGPADSDALVKSVTTRLRTERQLDTLTLFVAGVPAAYSRGTIITRAVTEGDPESSYAEVEQGAVMFPAGDACPSRPPLVRYAGASEPRMRSEGLCDDYQRAMAQIGTAARHDRGVARSFRAIAEDFVATAARDYVARDPGRGFSFVLTEGMLTRTIVGRTGAEVRLPPWTVEAHIPQAQELGGETDDFVNELKVALEEIDRAARARGCW